MSGEQINFSGDALAQRVPLLGTFRSDLADTIDPLMGIAECHWADFADDEFTMAARAAVRKMLADYVFLSYEMLGDAVGMQGDKLDLVRRMGENTEATNAETAGNWDGGRHG